MRRLLLSMGAAALVCGVIATPSASAQQSLNFFIGGFMPRPLDARDPNDVILNNTDFLSTLNRQDTIDMSKFNGPTAGGEYLVMLGRNFEAGLGLGVYQKSALTSYTNLVNQDGSEIAQTLKLRVVPFTATFKVLPFGSRTFIQPYVGAGVGIFVYRYSETGQFVDITDNSVFNGTFSGSGTATGPVVLGGARFPTGFGTIGGEIRYQSAVGKLPTDQGFSGSKIDLGGFNYLFTLSVKF